MRIWGNQHDRLRKRNSQVSSVTDRTRRKWFSKAKSERVSERGLWGQKPEVRMLNLATSRLIDGNLGAALCSRLCA